VGKLLRNRGILCRRIDWLAVCRADTHCQQTGWSMHGAGGTRVCDADHRPLWGRTVAGGNFDGAVARGPSCGSSVGHAWPQRDNVLGSSGAPDAPAGAYKPVFEDWLFHVLLPFAAYTALAVAAFAAGSHLRTALFAIGAAALLLLFVGIHNAWDAVTYHVFEKAKI